MCQQVWLQLSRSLLAQDDFFETGRVSTHEHTYSLNSGRVNLFESSSSKKSSEYFKSTLPALPSRSFWRTFSQSNVANAIILFLSTWWVERVPKFLTGDRVERRVEKRFKKKRRRERKNLMCTFIKMKIHITCRWKQREKHRTLTVVSSSLTLQVSSNKFTNQVSRGTAALRSV